MDHGQLRSVPRLWVVPSRLAWPNGFGSLYPAYIRGRAYLQLREGRLAAFRRLEIFALASTRLRNQLAFKHSSRSLPLKLSTCPFCIGRPVDVRTLPYQSASVPLRHCFGLDSVANIDRRGPSFSLSATAPKHCQLCRLYCRARPHASRIAPPAVPTYRYSRCRSSAIEQDRLRSD